MNSLRPRRPRLRLNPETYRKLHHAVLSRDGWRCQHCGSRTDLQVHHIMSRGTLGDDTEKNLISLCVACHDWAHRNKTKQDG